MTPPFLVPTDDSRLVIAGGNHRLAVARAKAVVDVPILVRAAHQSQVLRILGIPR